MADEEVPLDLTSVADNTLTTGWYEKRVSAYQELNQEEQEMINYSYYRAIILGEQK